MMKLNENTKTFFFLSSSSRNYSNGNWHGHRFLFIHLFNVHPVHSADRLVFFFFVFFFAFLALVGRVLVCVVVLVHCNQIQIGFSLSCCEWGQMKSNHNDLSNRNMHFALIMVQSWVWTWSYLISSREMQWPTSTDTTFYTLKLSSYPRLAHVTFVKRSFFDKSLWFSTFFVIPSYFQMNSYLPQHPSIYSLPLGWFASARTSRSRPVSRSKVIYSFSTKRNFKFEKKIAFSEVVTTRLNAVYGRRAAFIYKIRTMRSF